MVELWGRLRGSQVGDEEEFKEWISETKDVKVFAPHAAPRGVADPPHKQRHGELMMKHRGLD